MAIDNKYGIVTVEKTPGNPLGEDEPVVVFRARDFQLPAVLNYYAQLCMDNSPKEHIDAIYEARNNVQNWQMSNGDLVKFPD